MYAWVFWSVTETQKTINENHGNVGPRKRVQTNTIIQTERTIDGDLSVNQTLQVCDLQKLMC